MSRLGVPLVSLLALAACGTETLEDRPRTLEYITQTILAPNCATAACHSSFAQAARMDSNPPIPLVFDTVEHARATFQRDDLLIDHLDGDGDPTLIVNLTVERSFAPRMPFDGPLPNADLELIRAWILEGGPGTCLEEFACQGTSRVRCNAKHGFTDEVVGACE